MAREDHLNAALEIYLAWGPERSTPVQQRLRAKLPALPAEDFLWLEQQSGAILSAACGLADEIGAGAITGIEAHQRIQARWPSLDATQIGRAMHQGAYSFWRDNGCSPEEAAARLRRRKKK